MIKILKADEGMIKVTFPYNPVFVEKIKTISGLKWHPIRTARRIFEIVYKRAGIKKDVAIHTFRPNLARSCRMSNLKGWIDDTVAYTAKLELKATLSSMNELYEMPKPAIRKQEV